MLDRSIVHAVATRRPFLSLSLSFPFHPFPTEIEHSRVHLATRRPPLPSSSRLMRVHPSASSPLLLRLLRYKLRRSPGTVEIIKRRPAFGATSGIRVGALYSRHYPPRKLGRDETALSLSLSLFFYLHLFSSFFLPPLSVLLFPSFLPSHPPPGFPPFFSFRCLARFSRVNNELLMRQF